MPELNYRRPSRAKTVPTGEVVCLVKPTVYPTPPGRYEVPASFDGGELMQQWKALRS